MNILSMCTLICTFITHPLVHIHQKKQITPKSVNGPLGSLRLDQVELCTSQWTFNLITKILI
jgi:hypothetical protein